jgi:ribosomal protein L6P/L9E
MLVKYKNVNIKLASNIKLHRNLDTTFTNWDGTVTVYNINHFNEDICKIDGFKLKIKIPFFIDYEFNLDNSNAKFIIKPEYQNYQASKMMYYTFVSEFTHKVNGISSFYRGVINIQGLGYSCAVTKLKNNKYNLFFRFGFKDKYNYIMPDNILIENYETVKTKMVIYCHSLELLKQVQIQIQRLRYPKAFKLQGIYLNDTFPKVKKFVK